MEIKEVQIRKTVMIRTITPVSNISDVMGEAFTELGAYMEKNSIAFAGPPYARYYNMDMEALDVEMGFPVASESVGTGRIKVGELPAGKIASAVHVGPYDKLEETYIKLMEFVKEKGLEAEEWMYEFYLNSPMEVKPEELQTEICYPLK
ncbi:MULTISPECIES: GyrI-like domain-containing protein [unclassified Oceanispirochaeta]|uniref:GyrI-like domain-containing protein n=1 Tax=unclassified Oceanispirochaeta TaxID=2635722 RepID=UPI000E08E233|nr:MULTISPECIES: GyrI-like domain-containing protein [unclassified Oceanispirochaeta]MBF9017415.1 GyrI-like domain-containing protein [Oceanispirochaeta sp. M2]NPD73987.1 GyrI-like domain-containing protein [Oceanispirochaeta sp. M1]RDG30162.1 AraC family transcriptional regulator [Oceanispirochaeta sp. M1]